MSHLVTSDCLAVHSANICILQFINSLLLLLLLFLNCALKQEKTRKYMNQYKQLLVAFEAYKTRCRAIAGSTAQCGCKLLYISKFSAASRGFHCDKNTFEINNSINHGRIGVFNII